MLTSARANLTVVDVHALAYREDEARIASLVASHRCEHIYLDVGTNIGVQIRKLFEPHKYLGAPVYTLFDVSFGAAASGKRCRVCAIGVEPNPRHRAGHSRSGGSRRRARA